MEGEVLKEKRKLAGVKDLGGGEWMEQEKFGSCVAGLRREVGAGLT